MLNFMLSRALQTRAVVFSLLPKFQPAKLFSPVQFKCWVAFDDTDMVYYDAAFCVFWQRLYFSHQVKGENVLNAWISFTFGILFIYVF